MEVLLLALNLFMQVPAGKAATMQECVELPDGGSVCIEDTDEPIGGAAIKKRVREQCETSDGVKMCMA